MQSQSGSRETPEKITNDEVTRLKVDTLSCTQSENFCLRFQVRLQEKATQGHSHSKVKPSSLLLP